MPPSYFEDPLDKWHEENHFEVKITCTENFAEVLSGTTKFMSERIIYK